MHDPLLDEGRSVVGRRATRLDASALVHGDIDDDRAVLHYGEVFAADQPRRPRALHEHRPDHEVRLGDLLAHRDR